MYAVLLTGCALWYGVAGHCYCAGRGAVDIMFLCTVTTNCNLNLTKDKVVSVFCFFMFMFKQE
jgi:hypothetical protein